MPCIVLFLTSEVVKSKMAYSLVPRLSWGRGKREPGDEARWPRDLLMMVKGIIPAVFSSTSLTLANQCAIREMPLLWVVTALIRVLFQHHCCLRRTCLVPCQ